MIRMHRESTGWAVAPPSHSDDGLTQAVVAVEEAVQAVQEAEREREAFANAEQIRAEQAAIAAAVAVEALRQAEEERDALLAQQAAERETETTRQEELTRQAELAAEALRQAEESERQGAIEAQRTVFKQPTRACTPMIGAIAMKH